MSSSPLGYYRFGESAGPTANDSSGNGNNGTYNATGVTYRQIGALNNDPNTSVLFDGSVGTMVVAAPPVIPANSPTTIEAWIYPTTITGSQIPIICIQQGTGDAQLSLSLINGKLWGSVGNPAGTGDITIAGSTTLQIGNWYHIAETYDPVAGRLTGYINGRQEGLATGVASVPATQGSWYFARWYNAFNIHWPGLIDEAAIYSSALSSSVIASHASAGFAGSSFPIEAGWGQRQFVMQPPADNLYLVLVNEDSVNVALSGYVQCLNLADDQWDIPENSREVRSIANDV